jgi:hypothetical protein
MLKPFLHGGSGSEQPPVSLHGGFVESFGRKEIKVFDFLSEVNGYRPFVAMVSNFKGVRRFVTESHSRPRNGGQKTT